MNTSPAFTRTTNLKNRRFTTAKGNLCTVWETRGLETRNGFTGCTRTVRTFVECNGATRELDAGCSFQAEAAAKSQGW
jgi:hypothetical protein